MELLKIKAKNFCCFSEFSLNLEKAGLVWVTGKNKDTKSADNNGSGKSTLLKALTWTLYGQTVDGERGDGIIKSGCSESSVEISARFKDEDYRLIRVRKKGSPSFKVFKNDVEVKLQKKELQEKVNELIGLDYTAFRNTVFYGQNDSSRFADPETRDSERKDVLHKILGLGILKNCHEEVRKRRLYTRKKYDEILNSIETCKARIQEQRLDDLSGRMEQFEETRELKIANIINEINSREEEYDLTLEENSKKEDGSLKESIREAQNKIDNLTEILADYDIEKMTADLKKTAIDSDKIRTKIIRIKTEMNQTQGVLNVVNEQLSQLDGTNCPICNSLITKGSAKRHKGEILERARKLEQEIVENKIKINQLKKDLKKKDNEEISLRDNINSSSDIRESIRKIEIVISKLKIKISDQEKIEFVLKQKLENIELEIKRLGKEIDRIKNEENPFIELLTEAIKKAKLYNKQLKTLKKKKKKCTKDLSIIEFWFRGFSNQGLPSFMLDGVMPILTERTNYYLEILTDGDITVDFSTQREKKASKGEYRDEIDIEWTIEGITGYPPSGGQLKKIEIATDLSLMDLAASSGGRAPDILALDEILDGLDEKGVQRVLLLLQELRKKRGSIFVISHDDRMSEIFEKSIIVTKKNGNSSLMVL